MNERWSWVLAIVALLIAAAIGWHIYAQAQKCTHEGGVYARRWTGGYDCFKEMTHDQ